MNKWNRTIATFAFATLLLAGESRAQDATTEARLSALFIYAASDRGDEFNPEKQPARREHGWRLYKSWIIHLHRDVTAQVAPFLQDEYFVLRQNAVIVLGRTESKRAETELQNLSKNLQSGEIKNVVELDVLQLAISRARTRGLKGRDKVAIFAKGNDLSFEEIISLAAKVHTLGSGASGTQAQRIIFELIDMLYTMGKKGENIQSLVDQLSLLPVQKILLEGAMLPPDREAKKLVDYFAMCDVTTPWDEDVISFYMPQLGVYAIKAAVARLSETKGGQVQLGSQGREALMRSLMWNDDQNALLLLKPLSKSSDPWVRKFGEAIPKKVALMKDWSSFRAPYSPTLRLMSEY